MKEIKRLKLNYRKTGKGYLSASVNIPKYWLDEMQLNITQREIKVSFDGTKIIIEKVV